MTGVAIKTIRESFALVKTNIIRAPKKLMTLRKAIEKDDPMID